MNEVFIGVLNSALVSGFLILAVILARFLIKKAPKWISCALWGLVAIKLMLPIRVESIFSLVPSSNPIPSDIEYSAAPQIDTGIRAINQAVNPVLMDSYAPRLEYSVNPLQVVISVCAKIWIVGMAILFFYLLISYLAMQKKVAASEKIQDNIYVCDRVENSFILGILKPGIYLPSGLSTDAAECILEHEKTHLKRRDYLWKPLGFLILTVYWFDPLCWVAYLLFCKDMELACDERVTRDKDKKWKATYCQALLDCSAQRKMVAACPVAFGEVSVKERIKSILNYKKPAFWMILLAIVIGAITGICFSTSPISDHSGTVIELKNPGDESRGAAEDAAVLEKWDDEVTNAAQEWAQAIVQGDGRTIRSMATQEVIQDFENRELFIENGEDIYFSFGSSPMLYWGEEVTPYIIASQDAESHTVDILYYVWTSDPHVTVWREQITYTWEGSKFLVCGESMVTYDRIASAGEFFQAYPFALQGSLMDYYEGNGFGTALNEHAVLASSGGYLELFDPQTAALSLLNIAKDAGIDTEKVTYGDSDVCTVILHFPDGDVEVEMIHPYESVGIWVPRNIPKEENRWQR